MYVLVLLVAFVFTTANGQAEQDEPFDDTFDEMIRQRTMGTDSSLFSESNDPMLMEGDIVVNPKLMSEIAEMEKMAADGTQMFDAIKRGTWPNGKIPYTIAPGAERSLQSVITQAAKEYSDKTGSCIQWKYYNRNDIRQFSPNYVTFFVGRGCYSMIGRQARPQQISLGNGCMHKGIAIHEMMHALGFFHEQSRLDRDKYITINWPYIPSGLWYNFKKYQPGQADTLGEPYDKQSIMHYGNYAFTNRRGVKTISSKSNSNEKLGQRNGLSVIDVKQLKKYYKCKPGTGIPEPTVKPKLSCRDSFEFCVALGKYCSQTWVKANCKSKCGGCVPCVDTSTYAHSCIYWKKKNYCTAGRHVSFMAKHCQKTCEKCA